MAKARKKKGKKKAGKKRSTRRPSKKAEMVVVGSKVKAAVKAHGCNFGSDSLEALNLVVHWYIQQATGRAQANGRKTVRAHDFMVG